MLGVHLGIIYGVQEKHVLWPILVLRGIFCICSLLLFLNFAARFQLLFLLLSCFQCIHWTAIVAFCFLYVLSHCDNSAPGMPIEIHWTFLWSAFYHFNFRFGVSCTDFLLFSHLFCWRFMLKSASCFHFLFGPHWLLLLSIFSSLSGNGDLNMPPIQPSFSPFPFPGTELLGSLGSVPPKSRGLGLSWGATTRLQTLILSVLGFTILSPCQLSLPFLYKFCLVSPWVNVLRRFK